MTDIKFEKNYGWEAASPFWLVWNEDGRTPMCKHGNRDAAEAEAARLASNNPGRSFHVLAVMSSVSTASEVVGKRFDPTRLPPVAVEDVAPPPAPEFVAEDEVAF